MAEDQGADFELYRRPTKRDVFLATMEKVVPWEQLCELVEPYYPKGVGGRPPVGLERMLRMYFVQHWFNLADVACEEALLDSTALRRFVGIDLGRERDLLEVLDDRVGTRSTVITSQLPLVFCPRNNFT